MTKKIYLFVFLLVVTISFSSAILDKSYACGKIYNQIKFNLSDEQTISEILKEKNYGITSIELNNIKNNFDSECSNILGLILNPKELCKGIYFLVLSTDYNFTESQILDISRGLSISYNIVENYIENYENLCFRTGISNSLPERKFPKLLINKSNECDLKLSSFFELSFPLPEIYLGEKECEKERFWNNFLRLEEFQKSFKITGIRIYPIFFLFGIVFFIALFRILKSGKRMDKLIEKEKEFKEGNTIHNRRKWG